MKNPNFWKIRIPILFCLLTTETIHTFLESSHQTGIIRWGQNSDIATRLGTRAKFILYWRTHCNSRRRNWSSTARNRLLRWRCKIIPTWGGTLKAGKFKSLQSVFTNFSQTYFSIILATKDCITILWKYYLFF